MIGTGEYTTGYVHTTASSSDKKAGVIALTLFDLRRQGKIGRIAMAGTNGTKYSAIRQHLKDQINRAYKEMDISFDAFPNDDILSDPQAYLRGLDTMSPGDLVTIFTPDDTHFQIAYDAIERGLHVLLTKPPVKVLKEHKALIDAANRQEVLVAVEVHKRWDPIYVDARDRIRNLGDFSFFNAYMSQPKKQLETFRHWAGKSSDISYYLNSHHVDFHIWSIGDFASPVSVTATASNGVANHSPFEVDTEDTITLTTQWKNNESQNLGTAVYTASWIAPTSDVHSQQRFFYMGHEGEIIVDQAHRGYSVATDANGYTSANPLFMKYTPNTQGYFAGQAGYGYRSISAFVDAVCQIREGGAKPSDFQDRLATIQQTLTMTAILEAGRQSLDNDGSLQRLIHDDSEQSITITSS